MSYDVSLKSSVTNETLEAQMPHMMAGGTYCSGGTKEMWLNITYNYSKYYYDVVDKEHGIRVLHGLSGAESIPILKNAIAQLGNDTDPDYWKATEGNAKIPLTQLLAFAQMRPDGIWEVF